MINIFVALFLSLSVAGCGKGEQQAPVPATKPVPSPQVVSARIDPENPKAGDALKAVAEVKAAEGGAVALRYKWYVNDQPLYTETGDTLGPQFIRKRYKVAVEVTPSDTKATGRPLLSTPVVIGNTPPEVVSVKLTPEIVYPGDKITTEVEGRDADGDSLTYTYEWRRNGNLLTDATTEVLDTQLKRRDIITVTVMPSDGTDNGKPKRSNPIIIANRSPEITSAPPLNISDNNKYIYQVTARDPDGDVLSFSLENPPKGMTINPKTGLIEWSIPQGLTGAFQINIIASDGDAKAFQSFELILK